MILDQVQFKNTLFQKSPFKRHEAMNEQVILGSESSPFKTGLEPPLKVTAKIIVYYIVVQFVVKMTDNLLFKKEI